MRVAFIVGEFPTLSETFVINQITGIIDAGHDVIIFANSKPDEEKIHLDVYHYNLLEKVRYYGIPKNKIIRVLKAIILFMTNITYFKTKLLKSLNIIKYGRPAMSLMLFYLVILMKHENFDIIHCHFGPNGIVGAYLKEIGIGGKLVTTFHGADMSKHILLKGEKYYDDLFSIGDLFLPISNYWRIKLIDLGCEEEKTIVHRMGVELDKFAYKERNILPGDLIKILTVGRIVEKKGHEFAIRAILKIIKDRKNIQYLIAGDGPLRNRLESLVYEFGIEEYISFLGPVSQEQVIALYRDAHIFVLSSVTAHDGDQEGLPVVLVEALASGIPVVSTDHTGIPEIVTDGKSGFIVPEGDCNLLADRINYLIENPDIWPRMGEFGRKFVAAHFEIGELNRKLIGFYSSLSQM